MKAIIAGGTGLLGRRLTQKMAENGWQVVVLTRSKPEDVKLTFHKNVQLQQWDSKTATNWGLLIEPGKTVLINLAGTNPGAQRWSSSWKNEIFQSRLQTLSCMQEAIQKYKPVAFLQASATGIYGCHVGTNGITDREDSPSNFRIPTTEGERFRQEVCVQLEMKAQQAVHNTPTKCLLLRIGLIFSTEDGLYPYLNLASKFGCSRIGSGDQFMSWIHVDDCARAIEFLCNPSNTPTSGPINIVSPVLTTHNQIMQSIAKINGRFWNYIPLPGILFRWIFGESSSVVLDSQPVLPHKLQDLKFTFKFPTIDEANLNLRE